MNQIKNKSERWRRRATKASRSRRLRPTVRALEGRELLSTTWTVTSLADDDSAGTLRSVIGQANATAGDHYINFAVTGTITLTGGQLELSNTNGTDIITGPGANLLSIS